MMSLDYVKTGFDFLKSFRDYKCIFKKLKVDEIKGVFKFLRKGCNERLLED